MSDSELSVVQSELSKSAQLYSELVRLALVVSQLLRREVVDLVRLLCLQPLDAVEAAHQTRHVVLEEFDELRVQRIQVLHLLARCRVGLLSRISLLQLLLRLRILLLLEPFELVGQEGVLHKQLRIRQVLDDRNCLNLAFRKRHAADVLVLVLDPLLQPGALWSSEAVVNFARCSILLLRLVVDLLVDLYDFLVDLPGVLGEDFLIRVVKDIRVSCQTQVLQREVALLVNMPVVVL